MSDSTNNRCDVSTLPDGTEVPYMLCTEVELLVYANRRRQGELKELYAFAHAADDQYVPLNSKLTAKLYDCAPSRTKQPPTPLTRSQMKSILRATLVQQQDGRIRVVDAESQEPMR